MSELAAIRAQRAEVEALLAFTHAPEGAAKARAWWRLQQARRARLGTAGMTPLPAPPPGALSRWQALRLRLGLLRLDQAGPPRGQRPG